MLKYLLLLFLPAVSIGQIKLDHKISLFRGTAAIAAPAILTKMNEQVWKLKYGDMPQPELAISDSAAEINLLGERTEQPCAENQLAQYKDFRIANLKKTRKDITVIDQGIKEISGKKIGFLKFMSEAADSRIFNYYFFTVVDKKIMMFTFNCMEKHRKVWEKTADAIAESLRVK